MQVCTKDWHHDRSVVLRLVDEALSGVGPEPAPVEEPTLKVPDVIVAPMKSKMETVVLTAKPAPNQAGGPRYFVGKEKGSSKFWETVVNDSELTVRFDRIGTNGQAQTKPFTAPEAARHKQEKLIRSKTNKGYVDQSDTS